MIVVCPEIYSYLVWYYIEYISDPLFRQEKKVELEQNERALYCRLFASWVNADQNKKAILKQMRKEIFSHGKK